MATRSPGSIPISATATACSAEAGQGHPAAPKFQRQKTVRRASCHSAMQQTQNGLAQNGGLRHIGAHRRTGRQDGRDRLKAELGRFADGLMDGTADVGRAAKRLRICDHPARPGSAHDTPGRRDTPRIQARPRSDPPGMESARIAAASFGCCSPEGRGGPLRNRCAGPSAASVLCASAAADAAPVRCGAGGNAHLYPDARRWRRTTTAAAARAAGPARTGPRDETRDA